jgi:hypothetical protein
MKKITIKNKKKEHVVDLTELNQAIPLTKAVFWPLF